MQHDLDYMRQAIALAREALGTTGENPAVGCVLVAENGCLVGQGATQPGGRPHAEVVALHQAGAAAKGATAYVTLEPCSHYGKSPPCADALIAAGVSRVVIACDDPDPRVSGRGIAKLRAAGIRVDTDVAKAEAARDLAGFFSRQTRGRPLVTAKLATSLDGKMALANGQSQWITSAQARQYGHLLRARSDVIATGSGTVLADNARLTCRLEGKISPLRLLLDRQGRVPKTAAIFQDQEQAVTRHLTGEAANDLAGLLKNLGGEGINNLLLEAGPGLTTAFLRAGLIDRLAWFTAPKIMGGDARPALEALGLSHMNQVQAWHEVESRQLGPDRFSLLEPVDIHHAGATWTNFTTEQEVSTRKCGSRQ